MAFFPAKIVFSAALSHNP